MRIALIAAPVVALIHLAACAPEETVDANEAGIVENRADAGEGSTPETDASREPAENVPKTEAQSANQGDEAAANEPATVIPARFHGEWSAEPAACGRSHETRLRITAGELRFHESTGIVQAVKREGSGTIEVTAAYSGEGQSWTNVRRLALSGDGDALTVTGEGSTLTRSRCP